MADLIQGYAYHHEYNKPDCSHTEPLCLILPALLEVEYTDIRTYNLRAGIRSVDYSGTRKNGEVIIRLYDSQGNLLSESEPINSKKFNDVFVSDNGYATKIEIEYINFKGSFYFHF